MSWNWEKGREKEENSDVLTYLNVRNYGYANMKAIGALFSPGFDSSSDYQCKEEAKGGGWKSTGVAEQCSI